MASVDAEPDPAEPGPRHERATREPGRTPLVLLSAGAVLLLDQASKAWAVNALANRTPIHVIGSLQLALHYNTGSAFSLTRNLGPLIGLLAAVVVIGLAITGRSARDARTAVTIGLLIGGALGNLADRAFRSGLGSSGFLHGAVIDFIDLQWWPVFNVADSAISVGAVLLVILGFRAENKPNP